MEATHSQESERHISRKVDSGGFDDLAREGSGPGGASMQVHVSPYDVPDRIEARQREESGRWRFRIHYLDDEEPEETVLSDSGVTVRLGRNSGRVSSMEIDTEAAGGEWVKRALAAFESLGEPGAPVLNIRATRRALEQFFEKCPDIHRDKARQDLPSVGS